MSTATQRAVEMARLVIAAAQQDNACVVTSDLVDTVMKSFADTEHGKANTATVRRLIRAYAAGTDVRVILTDDERYWAIREQLHHMGGDEVQALCDSIADGGDDDPRAYDLVLIGALSMRLSKRFPPRRLDEVEPVSIGLWSEPCPPAVEEQPAPAETPVPVDDVKARRWAEGFAAKWWAEQHTEEPTDSAMSAAFAYTVKPPKPEAYPLIRASIAEMTPPAAAAPLFAVLAAHEAVRDASLSPSPRDLRTVIRHLETLPLAAPVSLHREIREAQNAVEEAWEAMFAPRARATRNAAHDKARTAIERARAVTLAVAPNACQMRGTDMPATAEEIRTAALAYNTVEGSPEELSAAETGTPTVRVHCRSDTGTGWTVTARITAGVDSPLGHIPAHPPIVVKFRKVDGRLDAAANARRVFGALFRVDVPVEYVADRRA
ncbi:hypothetical protein ACIP93_33610 [Streptomyces sp. NPDC088745]|uniref:hypothetical protein n=1 Tax=Streptomyces sp. NPDC088745 TaxID=3365884 RepID=UPI00381595DE